MNTPTTPTPPWDDSVAAPLPCPFCGHVGMTVREGSTYRWHIAECDGCGASAGEVRKGADPFADWNRRATLSRACAQGEPEAVPSDEAHAMNNALCAFTMRWKLDGDYIRCKACNRPHLAGYAHEPLRHAHDCPNTDQRPWLDYMRILAPLARAFAAGRCGGEGASGPPASGAAPGEPQQ